MELPNARRGAILIVVDIDNECIGRDRAPRDPHVYKRRTRRARPARTPQFAGIPPT